MAEFEQVSSNSSADVGSRGWSSIQQRLDKGPWQSLATAVSLGKPPADSCKLLAAVLSYGQGLSWPTSARAVLEELQEQRRDSQGIFERFGFDPDVSISSDVRLSPELLAEETLQVLSTAAAFAARRDDNRILLHHLMVAMLAPSEAPPGVQAFLRRRGYSLKRIRQRLLAYVSKTYGEEPFWQAILSGQPIAPIAHDQPFGADCLDVDAEVSALCRVLMAKKVEPPISLGLFGNWGTGKSFFMERMQVTFERIAQQEAAEASADYSKQLGIVSFVRRDFERLSQLMAKTSKLGLRAERAEPSWRVAAIDDEGIELQAGDLIRRVNGQDAAEIPDLESLLAGRFARRLKVQRQGQELDVELDFEKGADSGFRAERVDGAWRVAAITKAELGLKPEDTILSFNGRKAETIEDFAPALRSESWRLEIDRRGQIIEVEYEVPPDLPVERIFLYIDDLDRCKPRRVVEVLEAVHLLLAFKLFVVVVGVDPRWLRRALLSQYRSLLNTGRGQLADAEENDRDVATPQDYLEKIFQIPYILRPIGTGGYGNLIRSLAPLAVETGMGSAEARPQRPEDSAVAAVASPAGAGQAELFPPLLRLEPSERKLMESLAPLFSTPRTVKRFVNLYQMFRARVVQTDLPEFLGQNNHSGRFQAVQILLAVISSYPSLAGEILRRLAKEDLAMSDNSTKSWNTFVDNLPQRNPSPGFSNDRWEELLRALKDIDLPESLPPLSTFIDLVPHVARFSFSLEPIPQPRRANDNNL